MVCMWSLSLARYDDISENVLEYFAVLLYSVLSITIWYVIEDVYVIVVADTIRWYQNTMIMFLSTVLCCCVLYWIQPCDVWSKMCMWSRSLARSDECRVLMTSSQWSCITLVGSSGCSVCVRSCIGQEGCSVCSRHSTALSSCYAIDCPVISNCGRDHRRHVLAAYCAPHNHQDFKHPSCQPYMWVWSHQMTDWTVVTKHYYKY